MAEQKIGLGIRSGLLSTSFTDLLLFPSIHDTMPTGVLHLQWTKDVERSGPASKRLLIA